MRFRFYGALVVLLIAAARSTHGASPHPRVRQSCSVRLDGFAEDQSMRVDDLDGDGQSEVVLVFDCGATGNCHRLLAVSNAGHCPRLVAEWFGQPPVPQTARHRGLRDLSVFYNGGCAGGRGGLSHLVFNGENYVATEQVECFCGDEPDAGPRDPRCDSRQFR